MTSLPLWFAVANAPDLALPSCPRPSLVPEPALCPLRECAWPACTRGPRTSEVPGGSGRHAAGAEESCLHLKGSSQGPLCLLRKTVSFCSWHASLGLAERERPRAWAWRPRASGRPARPCTWPAGPQPAPAPDPWGRLPATCMAPDASAGRWELQTLLQTRGPGRGGGPVGTVDARWPQRSRTHHSPSNPWHWRGVVEQWGIRGLCLIVAMTTHTHPHTDTHTHTHTPVSFPKRSAGRLTHCPPEPSRGAGRAQCWLDCRPRSGRCSLRSAQCTCPCPGRNLALR